VPFNLDLSFATNVGDHNQTQEELLKDLPPALTVGHSSRIILKHNSSSDTSGFFKKLSTFFQRLTCPHRAAFLVGYIFIHSNPIRYVRKSSQSHIG